MRGAVSEPAHARSLFQASAHILPSSIQRMRTVVSAFPHAYCSPKNRACVLPSPDMRMRTAVWKTAHAYCSLRTRAGVLQPHSSRMRTAVPKPARAYYGLGACATVLPESEPLWGRSGRGGVGHACAEARAVAKCACAGGSRTVLAGCCVRECARALSGLEPTGLAQCACAVGRGALGTAISCPSGRRLRSALLRGPAEY